MFTGIIEACSPLIAQVGQGSDTLLQIARPDSFDDIRYGSSIACNGICLTVIDFDRASFRVQIMNETIQKTTAFNWKKGELINLERALKLGDRLDGHWLQGHVDKTARLLESSRVKDAIYLKVELDAKDKSLVIPQGSIALNGVSLTIAELTPNWLKVALIGHTIQNSNLAQLKASQYINIEFDVLGKYIQSQKPGITKDWLYEQGF